MPATAAISYIPESFETTTERLMGRNAASEAFLEAMARHAGDQPLYCVARNQAEFDHFDRRVAAAGNPNARTVRFRPGRVRRATLRQWRRQL